MYIAEIIIKWLEKRKQPKQKITSEETDYEDLKCEHLFLPIDSSSTHLACSKCGIVIKNNNGK